MEARFCDFAGHYALVKNGRFGRCGRGRVLEDIGWDAPGTISLEIAFRIFVGFVEKIMSTSILLFVVMPTKGCIPDTFQAKLLAFALAKIHSPDARSSVRSDGLSLEHG